MLAIAGGLLAGCGGSDKADSSVAPGTSATNSTSATKAPAAKQVKLRVAWWGGQPRHDYTIKVIEAYEKQNPNVKIEYEYASFDEYWKKLAPEAAANNLPDVLQMDLSYLTQYGSKDQLDDIQPYIDSKLIDTADIAEGALDGGKLDGKLYGFNLGSNALAMWADKEMLDKNGITLPAETWTWEDFEKTGMALKDKGIYLTGYSVPEQFFSYYLRQNGQTLYSKDGTELGYTDDSLLAEYFSMQQRLVNAKVTYTPAQYAQVKAPEDSDFIKDKMAFGIGYSNQAVADSTVKKKTLEMIPLPGPNSDKGLFLKPSMFFSIAKGSKQKEEAAKFINYFVNDVEANKLINADRGVPLSAKIKESLKTSATEQQIKLFDYVAWVEGHSSPIDPPDPIGSAEVTKILRDVYEQVLYSKVTPEKAAEKFRKQANAVLLKNKK
ncbi:MAG: sugar ABC transporter substrate-binding protein [Gorillibacterium sp.]|nr:sugar ABC transporter substrate-binding protein [Gorillibacterium sp.]